MINSFSFKVLVVLVDIVLLGKDYIPFGNMGYAVHPMWLFY